MSVLHSIILCAVDRLDACGGPYRWVVDFAASLKAWAESVEVLVLCPGGRPTSGIAAACAGMGISSTILDTTEAVFLEDQVEWIVTQWARRASSVFVANLVLPALYASRWIRKAGGRTVGVIHSDPDHDPFYGELLSHFVAGPAEWRLDAVVAVSDYIAQKVKVRLPAGPRVATIACGTLLPTVRTAAPNPELRLIYCGRLTQEAKRIRELTEALLGASRLPGVRASICGNGEERNWLESRLSGEHRVKYIGSVPPRKMHEVMAQHHAFVLLSDYEGLPLALVESMACGLVPICLDEPSGAGEIIRDGVNGLVVKDRGPSFLQAVGRLTDPDVWSALSVAANQTAVQRYSHPVVFAEWRNLLQNLERTALPQPGLVPRRIALGEARNQGWFRDYVHYRPTRRERLRSGLRLGWTAARLKFRPRSRLRALLQSRSPG